MSNPVTNLKVYFADARYETIVATLPGVVRDIVDFGNYRKAEVHEGILCDDGRGLSDGDFVVQYADDTKSTAWHKMPEAAEREAERIGISLADIQYKTATYKEKEIKRFSLPFETVLQEDNKDGHIRCFCRFETHPEINGSYNPGKVYFPDKRNKFKLIPGPIVVTSLVDKGNYGFFRGQQKQYEKVSEKALADYFRTKNLYTGYLHFTNGAFGENVFWSEKEDADRAYWNLYMKSPKGTIYISDYVGHYVTDDPGLEEIECVSVRDFLCQGYFRCTEQELKDKFVQFQGNHYTLGNRKVADTGYLPQAVEDAFVSFYTVGGLLYAEVALEYIESFFGLYSPDEMDEIAKVVSSVNTKANEKLLHRRAKG